MDKSKNNFDNAFLPITSINTGQGIEIKADLYSYTTQIVNVLLYGNPKENKGWVLIDAGMPHSYGNIMEAIKERFGEVTQPHAIILTHGHFDHVGALAHLLEKWDVPVYAHEDEIPYLTGEKDYPKGDPTVNGGLVSEMSPIYPNHGMDIGSSVHPLPKDGSLPEMSGWNWVHTPGHTPGHVSLFRDSDGTLIVGDAFVTVKQESLFKVIMQEKEISGPPKYFTTDWELAEESVKKLHSLNPQTAITGHGLPMDGDELTKSLQYLVENFKQVAIPEEGRYVQ